MTIANNYAPINQAADGVTVAFSGGWQMGSVAYARVYLENTTTGVLTLVNQGVNAGDYNVALNTNGFIVTFNTAPTVGNNVIIRRSTTIDQTDPYSTARGFQGSVEEDSFDKLTAIAQEINDLASRSITVPFSDTATNLMLPLAPLRVGKALIFDSSGNVTVSTDNYADQLALVTAQAVAAAASAASASGSASTASTAATTASSAATTASTSATSATASASTASTAATSASSSATSAAASAIAAAAGASGTSVTSNTIGTGSKSFTTQAGRNFTPGQFIVIVDNANDANYIHGQVTSYNSGTGALVVDSQDTGGSGTIASWNISISGPAGPAGAGSGTVNSGTSGRMAYYAGTGTAVSGNANATIVNGALTLGSSGVAGSVALSGATSGSTVLAAAAVATGTVTVPSVTDQIVCRATTDTLTNKTFDTAGTGNVFKIAGTTISANTGTGANVLATSPALTGTPTVPTAAGGTNTTQAASTAFVTAAVAAVSGNIHAGTQLTINPVDVNTHNIAHGLGVIPQIFDIRLVNLVTELGYSVGDNVIIGGNGAINGSANAAYTVSADGTNIYYSGAVAPSITNKSAASSSLITLSNWKLVITPYKIT